MATQRCPECRARLLNDAAFCHRCGQPRGEAATVVRVSKRRGRARGRAQLEPVRDEADDPERELWSDTFSAKGLVNHWVAGVIISSALLIAGWALQVDAQAWQIIAGLLGIGWATLIGWLIYYKLDVQYVLTTQRLTHRRGILLRRTNRIEVIDIDDVGYRQGILERLINVGTIELVSSDRTDPVLELDGINRVQEVAELMDEARRAERVRRGLHIESI